jgi:hypothetical protein
MNHHPAPHRLTLDRIAETIHRARIGAQLSQRTLEPRILPRAPDAAVGSVEQDDLPAGVNTTYENLPL